jgi:hypothetical protein
MPLLGQDRFHRKAAYAGRLAFATPLRCANTVSILHLGSSQQTTNSGLAILRGMGLPNRYDGRPILLIIENYALRSIGKLSEEKAAAVLKVVQRVWGGDQDWIRTVRAQLGWEPSMDEAIRKNWIAYDKAAREQDVPGSAEEFAMMFADAIESQANAD